MKHIDIITKELNGNVVDGFFYVKLNGKVISVKSSKSVKILLKRIIDKALEYQHINVKKKDGKCKVYKIVNGVGLSIDEYNMIQ